MEDIPKFNCMNLYRCPKCGKKQEEGDMHPQSDGKVFIVLTCGRCGYQDKRRSRDTTFPGGSGDTY